MNIPLPFSSPSTSPSSLFPLPLPLHSFFLPPSSPLSSSRSTRSFFSQATPTTAAVVPTSSDDRDQALLLLLQKRQTDEAWALYQASSHLPNSVCLSRLVSQLSHKNTPLAFTRAQSILTRLLNDRQLHRLDANSLGLLAVAATKTRQLPYAISLINSMLRSGYLPHVKAWSAVVGRLAASPDDGPVQAIRLFRTIVRRVRRVSEAGVVQDFMPDTAAYNSALNACANLGDAKMFLQLFDEMSEFGLQPDSFTYNVMLKLCARCDRKDLMVVVVEKAIRKGIPFCITTLQSVVAAYVGFGDLKTAEKLVQAMRDGRRDLCKIMREANEEELRIREEEDDDDDYDYDNVGKNLEAESDDDDEENVFELLLPVEERETEPPLLPKAYAPNTRLYTTLMKGYMKQRRLTDTVRMLEAMRQEDDKASLPDHVSYTTVVSAFVKAGLMDRARQVLAEMTRIGVPANRITYNILLKGYCEQLQIDKAKELMKEMEDNAEIEPDVVSYNIMIDGCIMVDDSAEALTFFNKMRSKGIPPTKVSYTTLMKAFARSGQPNLASKVFDEMQKDSRVKVDLVAWNMLVEGYCKLGLVQEAKKAVEKMKESGFYPDVATYGSLANGIALAKKPGEALLLWKELKDRCEMQWKGENSDPDSPPVPPLRPDGELLDTLADICVRGAFFQKALEIVACMEEYRIPPNKSKYKKIYVEMHSRMFTSKHASQARQDRRKERKRAAEAFKFWLGLPNEYYGSEWRVEPLEDYRYI
ncbi:Pentatricopeptide repeat-containing protein At3g09650, chloroplastic [Linum perenne]